MKVIILFGFLSILITKQLLGQSKKPEDLGFRHFQTFYQKDPVDILILSKKGEEKQKKPLFLFIQGSLPKPLILYSDHKTYNVFPFNASILLDGFHLAIVSKPYVPLMSDVSLLKPNMAYVDSATGLAPVNYSKRNYLDYYAKRNKRVIRYLLNQGWFDKNKVVVAGHSEGAAIAAKLAMRSNKVTHLIFSSTNPFGRMATIVSQIRANDDSVGTATEQQFEFWKEVVKSPENNEITAGDTFKAIYSFFVPPIHYLRKLKIPVMVTYGTKDVAAPFFDYMRIEIIQKKKKNFTFKPYVGREHNFFGFDKTGQIDYDQFGWDKVAEDWKQWLTPK